MHAVRTGFRNHFDCNSGRDYAIRPNYNPLDSIAIRKVIHRAKETNP